MCVCVCVFARALALKKLINKALFVKKGVGTQSPRMDKRITIDSFMDLNTSQIGCSQPFGFGFCLWQNYSC